MTTKEIRTKWVEALRSGQYKQGKHKLHYADDFCCLGVLCEILKEPLQLETHESLSVSYNGELYTPPSKVRDAAQLTQDLVNKLVVMNDDENKTFEQIADYIESL